LKNKTFRQGFNDSDYLTRVIDYDYSPSTQEDRDFMMNVFKKICNWNDEHLKYYLSVFGYSLLGDAELEKSMYFLVGQGGNNGKTLILDALAVDIMPCYVSKIERMTFEMGYSKAHKHLVGIKGMRIIYIEELRKNKMNEALLKEIADGKTIKNEVMFGTNEEMDIMCKLFALSNHTPNFDNDGGTENRYNQLQFNSCFNKDNTEDNYETLSFVRDNKLAEKIKNKYKLAVCDILFDFAHQYTVNNALHPTPAEFIEATKETIAMNSPFKTWFEENCEVSPEGRVGKKDLVDASRLQFRELNDDLRNMGFKYNRDIRVNGIKGGWVGFKLINYNNEE
jgi:phage/plasmid-associated DNA primase